MSFTLSLLIGLLWLLPGIVALVYWNYYGRLHGVSRTDEPLTAISSLALTVGVSLLAHLFGVFIAHVIVGAFAEASEDSFVNPYRIVIGIMTRPTSGPNAQRISDADVSGLLEFGGILILLCMLTRAVMTSKGFSLAFFKADTHGQGWAFQHIVLPKHYDYVAVAFVLTKDTEEGRGLGYAGAVSDIRLTSDGELKSIALGEPDRFLYDMAKDVPPQPVGLLDRIFPPKVAQLPDVGATLRIGPTKQLGGVVFLSGENIRNILVHNYSKEEINALSPEEKDTVATSDAAP